MKSSSPILLPTCCSRRSSIAFQVVKVVVVVSASRFHHPSSIIVRLSVSQAAHQQWVGHGMSSAFCCCEDFAMSLREETDSSTTRSCFAQDLPIPGIINNSSWWNPSSSFQNISGPRFVLATNGSQTQHWLRLSQYDHCG